MHTPVILIIFRRPDLTERLLQSISRVRPRQLFVVADGPRTAHPDDQKLCKKTRELIDQIDWDCEVYKNYSDRNLGCGARPATGITWAFKIVDRAIILEDDCIPADSFFTFCEEMLERYKDDERIMHVSGNNFQSGERRGRYSYYFSQHPICWGWATWKRAWQHHDMSMQKWPVLSDIRWLERLTGNVNAAEIYHQIFREAYRTRENAHYWDYQWTFACWSQSGLSISPNATLVTNLGCRDDGTHTLSPSDKWAELKTEELILPISHPPYVVAEFDADEFLAAEIVSRHSPKKTGLAKRFRQLASRLVPEIVKKKIRMR
jgi:hypothetical protein